MANHNSTLTADRLRELLDYSPDTGAFVWRVNRGSNKTAGKIAGTVSSKGYVCISIDGREYHAHALAWLYAHGTLPSQRQIVRLNDDPADNRIDNLALHVKSAEREISLERLNSELDYNPQTGIFRWKISPVNSIKAGDIAGAKDKAGYIRIKIGNTSFSAHRLAWFMAHGSWPEGEIDHINGVCSDNRLINLRVVSRTGNVQNRRAVWGKSGYMGVYPNHGKWRAAIQVEKRTINLGNFETPEAAHAAYLEAKRKLHPTFAG